MTRLSTAAVFGKALIALMGAAVVLSGCTKSSEPGFAATSIPSLTMDTTGGGIVEPGADQRTGDDQVTLAACLALVDNIAALSELASAKLTVPGATDDAAKPARAVYPHHPELAERIVAIGGKLSAEALSAEEEAKRNGQPSQSVSARVETTSAAPCRAIAEEFASQGTKSVTSTTK
ncbi:hypothetical protein ASD62_03735 [Phycicoccus sp. Root563]|uniref:hypothetical protein n=1 Tax=Phycicoccus sp. Root563 TaxID=1736562 RepID=UPI000702BC18|nr:hypothetical protein [Phycicoccus sp. Root563]KQZ88553.1 hypothetical protein ASD62_03735 [Phycicoccus sp. Root563]